MTEVLEKNPRVLFYGAIGGMGTARQIGGGETGNKKTIGYLENIGFEIVAVGKPYPKNGKQFRSLRYFAHLLKVFLLVSWKILTSPSIRNVHVSGFYMHLVYHECALILVSKMLRRNVIYELRGSGVQRGYEQRSAVYRAFFRWAIANSNAVLCQGSRYKPFIQTFTDRPVIHYPNCNELHHLTRVPPFQDLAGTDIVRLIYFGRVVESKRPDISINVCSELRIRGIDARLEIVGKGNEYYLDHLRGLANSLDIQGFVSFHLPMETSDLVKFLTTSHFFVFPSQEEREGQSNALTEAMAVGVVPVVSNAGFNAEIVADEFLVVLADDEPSAYCDIIIEVIRSGNWSTLSSNARTRVKKVYSEEVALGALRTAYCS